MRRYTPGSEFGSIAIYEYEEHKFMEQEEELRRRFDREMELKEKELQLKTQENIQLADRLDKIESSLYRIERTLSKYESQYLRPFSLVLKINK